MKAIIKGYAWLDTHALSPEQRSNLRDTLTIYPRRTSDVSKKEPEPILMYREDDENGLFGVPRQFYRRKKTEATEEVIDVSHGMPMSDEMLEGSLYTAEGPYVEQEQVLTQFINMTSHKKYGGFILKADCAFGKTIVAVEFARRLGRRTLILVNKEFFVRQWRDRILEVCPQAKIGIIQQKKCEYEDKDFVIGMCHSLAKEDKYTKDIYETFGLVVTDEVHRISAHTWAPILPQFNAAWRLGLTATPRRKDGAEDVFFEHIGEIAYSAKTQSSIPKIRKIFTTSTVRDIERGEYKVTADKLSTSQVTTQLSKDMFRTRQIVEDIAVAVRMGKKLMVVSERLEHLKKIAEDLSGMLLKYEIDFPPVIDYYTGEWFTGEEYEETVKSKSGKITHRRGDLKKTSRTEEDLKKAERANVIMATKQMVEEGLDIASIDVEVFATPISDVEQAAGRVRRWCTPDKDRKKCKHLCPWRWKGCSGKAKPIIVEVIDEQVPQAVRRWKKRKGFYRSIGAL